MFAPRLGDIVQIQGTTVRGIWKLWNSHTERAVVIDEDGVLHETYRKHLRGERIVYILTESVIRKGNIPVDWNIGRVMAIHADGNRLSALMPSGKVDTAPLDDWDRAPRESVVEVSRVGDRTELLPPWQGGQPVRDTRTTEEKNIDEFARVADLRADNETVEQNIDADDDAENVAIDAAADEHDPLYDALVAAIDGASDSPLPGSASDRSGEGQGVMASDHPAAPDEMVAPDLPAETDLPPGEPESDAVVERIMTADATAPAQDAVGTTRASSAAPTTADDLANIIDMLRRRIAQLEDDHMDTLALIAALPGSRPADAPRTVETTTLFQEDNQNWQDRNNADAELTMMRNLGWTVVDVSNLVHPQNFSITRIVLLERAVPASNDGARATAAAVATIPTPKTSATHIQSPAGDGVTVVMHPSPEREIAVNSATLLRKDPALRQPLAAGRMTILPPERSADSYSPPHRNGEGVGVGTLPTLDQLNAEVFEAANAAVEAFRAVNPPPVYTPFPSALPAGQ
jgi:hypothetical protein